jgi:hypothetical protein
MVKARGIVEEINIREAINAWGTRENLTTWKPLGE